MHWGKSVIHITQKLMGFCIVNPENIHTPPTEGIGNSGEEAGVSKTQKFKGMYEAKLEFPEGWGGHRANPFRGGIWIFSETTHYVYHVR